MHAGSPATTAPGSATRRTPTLRRPQRDTRPGPHGPPPRSPGPPRSAFWAHRPLEQLVHAPRRREFTLELSDPTASRDQLRVLRARHPGQLAPINALLSTPVVDRLTTHTQISRDLRDRPPSSDQIQDLATELRRISPWHADPSLRVTGMASLTNRLHRTGGTSGGSCCFGRSGGGQFVVDG